MSWLDPVRRALDERATPCPVFFRDDDAGRRDDRLTTMLDRFAERDVGVDVAVIPGLVHRSLAALLTAGVEAGGVRVHQHGLAHVDHEAAGRKHEFGPARGLDQQVADVAAGRRLMLHWFGAAAVEPVFTPPWNRCTADTGRAVLIAGLPVLSRDRTAEPLAMPGLVEVPVTLDWFGHRRGVRWTPAELGTRLADQLLGGDPVGVMLHHAVTDADDLAMLDGLLALVARHPGVRLTSIAELAARTGAPA